MTSKILLAYYGDDFTGSTDALEFLYKAGLKTVLFMDSPTAADLAAFPGLNAYGIAGKTRSLLPAEMKQELTVSFAQMKASGVRHIHYKICSTFDSSPTTGNIGTAIETGIEVLKPKLVPVLGGMPALGRYCVFGNLFAKMGIGSTGEIYRLDRHPSMRNHPVTPATESDLRLHLAQQTDLKTGLIDIVQNDTVATSDWVQLTQDPVVLLDASTPQHISKIGVWLDTNLPAPVFSVGSSGIEMGLGTHWNDLALFTPVSEDIVVEKATPLLVISGSCSPVSLAQIEWATQNGFTELIIDAYEAAATGNISPTLQQELLDLLQQGKHVILHTGLKSGPNLSSSSLGTALGLAAKNAMELLGLKRLVVAGGDTSSYAARALEIKAVSLLKPLVTGAPLCTVISDNEKINGLEINFKGGQVGADNYFETLVNGAL